MKLKTHIRNAIRRIFRKYDLLNKSLKFYKIIPVIPLKKKIYWLFSIRYSESKIFGIGLSRTGTTSLTYALKELGFTSIHSPKFLEPFNIFYIFYKLRNFKSATDIVVAVNFKLLDKMYPKSKFILTIRNIETWLESCKKFISTLSKKRKAGLAQKIMYGCSDYNREKFRDAYYKHHKDIEEYLKNRPDDLLIMNIEREGYEKLCPFLGREVLDKKFPRKNTYFEIFSKLSLRRSK